MAEISGSVARRSTLTPSTPSGASDTRKESRLRAGSRGRKVQPK